MSVLSPHHGIQHGLDPCHARFDPVQAAYHIRMLVMPVFIMIAIMFFAATPISVLAFAMVLHAHTLPCMHRHLSIRILTD